MPFPSPQTIPSPQQPVGAALIDTWPPAVPTGLVATAHPSFVMLRWDSNTEPDLAGHRLHRDGVEIYDGLRASFSDLAASAKSSYTVSAYDQLGNESAQSAAVQVTVRRPKKPIYQNPHFAFPFQRSGGVRMVEQDTEEHVMACEHVIVRCPVGFRAERPEFGWPFPEFRTIPLDLSELEAALRRWEPRGQASAQEWADEADAAVREIQVEVEVGD